MGEVTYRGLDYWNNVKAMRFLKEKSTQDGWAKTVIAQKEAECTDPLIKARYLRVIHQAA
jgi:hypothetical protein